MSDERQVEALARGPYRAEGDRLFGPGFESAIGGFRIEASLWFDDTKVPPGPGISSAENEAEWCSNVLNAAYAAGAAFRPLRPEVAAVIAAARERIAGLEALLAAYRTGARPKEKDFQKLEGKGSATSWYAALAVLDRDK